MRNHNQREYDNVYQREHNILNDESNMLLTLLNKLVDKVSIKHIKISKILKLPSKL